LKTPSSTPNIVTLVLGRIQSRINRSKESQHLARVGETVERAIDLDQLQAFLGVSDADYARIEGEFSGVKEALKGDLDFVSTSDLSLLWLEYLLCRHAEPEHVVETGVWIGSSSYTILSALEKNGKGKLSSIDFPPFRPKNRVSIGRVVTEALYPRWSLHLGPSKSLLPKLARGGEVDIFIHDSDHTYLNMMAEFRIGWDLLKPGGYLVSDDSSTNDSILDFSDEIGEPVRLFHRIKGGTVGIIRKPGAAS